MNLVSLIPFDDYGDVQKTIITLKVNDPSKTYADIRREIKNTTGLVLYDHDLSSCMLNSALGFKWDKSTNKAGRRPYLCPKDVQELKERSEAIAHETNGALDPAAFINLAVDLKTTRISKATIFYGNPAVKKIAMSLKNEETVEPTRPWVN